MACFQCVKRCCTCCGCVVLVVAVALGVLKQRIEATTCSLERPSRKVDLPQRCLTLEAEAPRSAAEAADPRRKRKYTLAVYGATGFTGGLASEYLAGRAGRYGVSWAVAGRNRERLEALRRRLEQGGWWGGPVAAGAASLPDVVVAEASDLPALRRLAEDSNAVLSLAGPYAQFGSPLVEACAREGSHYVDITGEIFWIRRMADQFSETARETGAALLFSAGYDSAPFDLMATMVVDAVARTGDVPTEVRTVVLRTILLPTWGSAKSGIGILLEILTGKASKDAKCDPYLHLRGRGLEDGCEVDVAVNGFDQVPRTPDEALFGREVGPTTPHALGDGNARYVRYSLHALGYRNVSYSEEQLADGANLIGELLANGSLQQGDLMPQATLPEVVTRGGFFEVEVAARGLGGRRASLRLESRHGDPGYNWTAAMAVEAALCLADVGCRRPGIGGGFHTAATAMGIGLARRIEDAGIVRWSGLPLD